MQLRSGLLDFLIQQEDECIDSDDSADEEEMCSESSHDSRSELSEEEVEATQTSDKDYFFGRGKNQKIFPKSLRRSAKGIQLKRPYHKIIDEPMKWKKVPYSQSSKTKSKNIIKFRPGLTSTTNDITDQVSAFRKIINKNMIEDIVKYTNTYIASKRISISYERERDCKDTTRCEILALIGILFLVGIKKGSHTNVLELWATNGTGIQILRAAMSYKRFLFLLRSLRFDDKETRTERREIDKLAAIRSILDSFVQNCKNSYIVGECVAIDEMLHPFRGRCSFVQYIPSKPAKYGLKCFAMCDTDTFYTSNLEVYCGKQPSGPYEVSNSPEDIVKRLVKPIEYTNRNLTTDNWYTSLKLATYLLDKKITLLGTMRKNKREIPPEFLPHKNREIESSLFGFQKQATLVSYVPKKNKSVILLSTMHDFAEIDDTTNKPEIILAYNKTKGAVDTVDQMCGAYSVSRITKRWPVALFFVMLNIAGVNAQILYFKKHNDQNQYRRRLFLTDLAFGLLQEHLVLRAKITSLPTDIRAFLLQHFPAKEDEPIHSGQKRGRCKLCKNSNTTITCHKCNRFVCKKHSKSSIICETCEINMSLEAD